MYTRHSYIIFLSHSECTWNYWIAARGKKSRNKKEINRHKTYNTIVYFLCLCVCVLFRFILYCIYYLHLYTHISIASRASSTLHTKKSTAKEWDQQQPEPATAKYNSIPYRVCIYLFFCVFPSSSSSSLSVYVCVRVSEFMRRTFVFKERNEIKQQQYHHYHHRRHHHHHHQKDTQHTTIRMNLYRVIVAQWTFYNSNIFDAHRRPHRQTFFFQRISKKRGPYFSPCECLTSPKWIVVVFVRFIS